MLIRIETFCCSRVMPPPHTCSNSSFVGLLPAVCVYIRRKHTNNDTLGSQSIFLLTVGPKVGTEFGKNALMHDALFTWSLLQNKLECSHWLVRAGWLFCRNYAHHHHHHHLSASVSRGGLWCLTLLRFHRLILV